MEGRELMRSLCYIFLIFGPCTLEVWMSWDPVSTISTFSYEFWSKEKKNWNKLPAFENGWREAKVVFIIEAKSRFSCAFACLFRMPSWGVCVLLLACVKCYLAGFQFWWVFIHKPIYSSRKSTVCAATSSK